MENSCAIQYGGFMMTLNTWKEELLCVIRLSKSYCTKSAIKLAEFYNQSSHADFDMDTLRIRCRKLEEYVGSWREEEKAHLLKDIFCRAITSNNYREIDTVTAFVVM